MKRTLLSWSAAVVLLAAISLPLILHGQPRTPLPAAAPAAPAAAAPNPAPERHPEILAAIRALENAKGHLESAAHDFHGHRVKAIGHVNQALDECNKALESD
jgi:hypothetical protein